MRRRIRLAESSSTLGLLAGLSACAAHAAEPGFTLFSQSAGNLTIPASSLSFLLVLPFLPALLLSMSAFVRMAVVFFLLRHALGSQYAPPNLVLAGLALLLTYFVMYPTLEKIQQEAYLPYTQGQLSAAQAGDKAALAAQDLHGAPDPRRRSGPVHPGSQGEQSEGPRCRCAARTGAGLSHQRVENRVPDCLHGDSAFSRHRFGGGERADEPGHGDGAAAIGVAAAQAAAVRDGGRLASCWRGR